MATAERTTIDRVEHDVATNWYSIYLNHPEVKKVTTKMQQKANEAAAFRQSGEVVDVQYSEKQGQNVNPHTGQPYVNRYYEKATPHAPAPTPTTNGGAVSGIDTIQPAQSSELRRTHPLDAWRMTLAAAGKLAVMTLPLLPVEQRGPEDQWTLTVWWATRLYTTPPPVTEQAGARPGAYSEPVGFDSPPPHGDDDIPF